MNFGTPKKKIKFFLKIKKKKQSTERLTSTLQTVKVVKEKERLRNCHTPEVSGVLEWIVEQCINVY